jgi:hypothetical protein
VLEIRTIRSNRFKLLPLLGKGVLRPFIPLYIQPQKPLYDVPQGFNSTTFLVGILYPENEFTPMPLGEQVIEEGRTGAPNVEVTRWAWRETYPHLFLFRHITNLRKIRHAGTSSRHHKIIAYAYYCHRLNNIKCRVMGIFNTFMVRFEV